MSESLSDDHAKETARRYLKNIVVIDNEISFGQDGSESSHKLNGTMLTNSLAELGITCSVMAPNDEDSQSFEALQAAAKRFARIVFAADIAVLDWKMAKTPGEEIGQADLCIETVKSVIMQDLTGSSPRLLVIYTGEPVTDNEILNKLLENISGKPELDGVKPVLLEDNIGFAHNRLRVIFLCKQRRKPVPGAPDESDGCPLEDLPERLITEFSAHTKGILPSTVYNIITTLREHIPSLLALYRSEIDPAFVQHLLQIPDTEDGYEFLVEMIKDSLTAPILSDERSNGFMADAYLREWFQIHGAQHFPKLQADDFMQFVNLGNTPSTKECDEQDTLCTSCGDIAVLREFARLSVTKRDRHIDRLVFSSDSIHSLSYGSILRHDTRYYLCLLPRCDSVRIDGNRIQVPLLKLKTQDGSGSMPHIVLRDGEYVCLRYATSKVWKDVEIITFAVHKKTKRVLTVQENGIPVFLEHLTGTKDKSETQPRKFVWVADLKDSSMLAIHQKAFANMSRMGTDEFEWLRRNQTSKH